jgi:hypothetical protein
MRGLGLEDVAGVPAGDGASALVAVPAGSAERPHPAAATSTATRNARAIADLRIVPDHPGAPTNHHSIPVAADRPEPEGSTPAGPPGS